MERSSTCRRNRAVQPRILRAQPTYPEGGTQHVKALNDNRTLWTTPVKILHSHPHRLLLRHQDQ